MDQEIEETIVNLCSWVNDTLENGCSSQELQLLPELVKATSQLRVAYLEKKAATAMTTEILKNELTLINATIARAEKLNLDPIQSQDSLNRAREHRYFLQSSLQQRSALRNEKSLNYFLVYEKSKERHLVCATDSEELEQFLKNDEYFDLDYYYQLKADTFHQPGFIMSEEGA